jgi:hypothetical protein
VTVADDDLTQFEPEPGAEFVWMIHDEGTVPAHFPIASVPGWQARGWKPCAAPPEIDPALIERTPPPAAPAPAVDASDDRTSKEVTERA